MDAVNMSKAVFFVSEDLKTWAVNDWPFMELCKRMKNEGKEIQFAFTKPDLDGLNARQIQEVMEAKGLFGLKVMKNNPIPGFNPMVQLEYTDGETKQFFSEDFCNAFSSDWGVTDNAVYHAFSDYKIQLENWDIKWDDLITEDQILFEFKIKEKNVNLSKFFKMLTQHKTEKWEKILEKISNRKVSIIYRDTYLVEPIGVLMINNLLKSMKESLNLTIKSLKFDVSAYSNFGQKSTGRIIGDFISKNDRRDFISESTEELLGVVPEINQEGWLPHWRELAIEGVDFELIIRPNGGIKNGWAYDKSQPITYYHEVEFDDDLLLFNQSNTNGILYNVIFEKKKAH